MLRQLFVICVLVVSIVQASRSERIRLSDVQVLTLHHGKWTTGRRTRPAPQLTCTGGTNRCKHLPATVQCYNRGSDGQDIQWECKSVMNKNLRFNKIEVTCEGYDYPEDDYVLVGSCGLEYSIDTVDGKTPFPEPHFHKPDPRNIPNIPHKFSRKDEPGIGTVAVLGIIASLMYLIYSNCIRPHQPDARPGPPPPGFRTDHMPSAPPSSASSSAPRDGPGFWSGMGLGGLAGYFAGRQQAPEPNFRTENFGENRYPRETDSGWNRSSGWSSWFGSSRSRRRRSSPPPPRPSAPDESSGSAVATGFGGTKRR